MSRFVVSAAISTVLALGAGIALGGLARARELPERITRQRVIKPRNVTVYLHRDGGRVTAGSDNPVLRRSGVLERSGISSLDVPRYRSTDARWGQLVQCVDDKFADFNVNVVDREPSGGNYVLTMIGGAPSQFRMKSTVGGVAPHNNEVISNALVFVFQTPHKSTRSLCETTAHEVGHALGLDHSRQCSDVMSYESCGEKTFKDVAVACGEWSDRTCGDGSATQSSWLRLAQLVGVRPASSVRTPTPAPAPIARPSQATLAVTASTPRANSTYTVTVRASDPDGISKVDIIWYDQRARRLRCGETNRSVAFTCTRRGSEYTFRIPVRSGSRKFVARVTDGKGHARRTVTYAPKFK